MTFTYQVILIGFILLLLAVVLYYYLYSFYINLKNRKYRLPDVRLISVFLLVIATISVSIVITTNQKAYQPDSIECYQTGLTNQFSPLYMNHLIESIYTELEPADNQLYASSQSMSLNLDNSQIILDMYIRFYIVNETQLEMYSVSLDSDNQLIYCKAGSLTDVETDNYSPLEDVLMPLENLDMTHVINQIKLTDSKDFMKIDFNTVPRNYTYKYEGTPNMFIIDKDGHISVTTEGELNSHTYDVYEISKLVKQESGGYRSSRDVTGNATYLIEK